MSLAQSILEQHAASGRITGAFPPGAPLAVRPDLLVADRETLRMPLGRFAASGPARPAVECLVASDRPGAPGSAAADPEYATFAALARACGLVLAPPRAGDRASLAFESVAAPGRLIATLGSAPEAGALGALAVPVGELEALALLCGDPLDVEPAAVRRIALAGELPPRCEGHDVAGALVAAHPRGFAGARVQFEGEVAALSIADRAAICRALTGAGAAWVIFPSDDRTRDFLRARGRESDWRRTEPGSVEGATVFDLGWTVPHALSCARPGRAVPLAWWNDVAVQAVEVGPGLELETLARFALLLRGRTRAEGTTLSVRPWAGVDAAAPEGAAVRATLAAARARWLGEGDLAPRFRPDQRLRLFAGLPPDPGHAGADDWSVSLLAAAEAACAGIVTPPPGWPDPHGLDAGAAPVRAPFPMPALGRGTEAAPRGRARRGAAPPAGLRGPVLGRIEGTLDDASLLPYGPRLEAELADPARLGEHVAPTAARGAGLTATGATGGWLLVLGEVRGIERREAGLLALRALGVRAILAAGFEARARARCARAGLLALRTLRDTDLDAVRLGDELELVGGIDTWVPDRARVVRDLTRAVAMVALPELTRAEWDWVAAGGTAC